MRLALALAQIDLLGDGSEGIGRLGVYLVWKHNVADPKVEHVVHDSHEPVGVAKQGTVHPTCRETLVRDTVRSFPEVIELADDVVESASVCVIIYANQ